jgi:phospholipid/cholesterol/gamma-HCH transport system substrate-binding protein
MNGKVNYIAVGLFVILLTVALIAGVLWLGAGGSRKEDVPYVVYMNESVSGLSKDAPVNYRGVNVGRVKAIKLDPNDPRRVRILLLVRPGTPIKEDTVATLELQGLTGIANINLTGGSPDSPLLKPQPGQRYPVIKSKTSLLGRLDQSITTLLNNLIESSNKLNQVLGPNNQRALGQTLNHMATASRRLEQFTDEALPQVDALVGELRATAISLRRTSDKLARNPSVLLYGEPNPQPGPGE